MSSFENNKIFGAFCATLLGVLGLGALSASIYSSPEPAKEGFLIEAAAPGATDATAPAAEAVPLVDLLKTANAEKGKKAAAACAACHSFEKGGANKVGPNLWNVVDRPIASVPGFDYSPAMKKRAEESKTWTYENLNLYLTKPSAFVPATRMSFGGMKDASRADMLAYLQSLSETPKPFPDK